MIYEVALPRYSSKPVALLSNDGQYLAVSYLYTASPTNRDAEEEKLAYFDSCGQRCFRDKGSALFCPQIAAIAADGSTLTVQSGRDTLFTLSAHGNFISKLRLAPNARTGETPTIQRTLTSQDGKSLLLHRSDGKLTLLRTS